MNALKSSIYHILRALPAGWHLIQFNGRVVVARSGDENVESGAYAQNVKLYGDEALAIIVSMAGIISVELEGQIPVTPEFEGFDYPETMEYLIEQALENPDDAESLLSRAAGFTAEAVRRGRVHLYARVTGK